MKKIAALVLAAALLLTAASALAEGEVLIGQVNAAPHGTGSFAVVTAVVQDDKIIAAKIDEFQFLTDREDLAAVGVPNSDQSFGESYPEGKVLGSKRENNELYSLNMQRAGSTVQIAANYNAIEKYVVGKTIAELEAAVEGYTDDNKADFIAVVNADFVDGVTSATVADSLNYVKAVLTAAKAAKGSTGTYIIYNKTGENVTELYLIDNLTGEQGVNYAANGFAADAVTTVTRTVSAEEIEAGYSMTISFKTEGGLEGQFTNLHIEEAPFTLLDADAMTSATNNNAVRFFAPED